MSRDSSFTTTASLGTGADHEGARVYGDRYRLFVSNDHAASYYECDESTDAADKVLAQLGWSRGSNEWQHFPADNCWEVEVTR